MSLCYRLEEGYCIDTIENFYVIFPAFEEKLYFQTENKLIFTSTYSVKSEFVFAGENYSRLPSSDCANTSRNLQVADGSIYWVSNDFKVIKLQLTEIKEALAENRTVTSDGEEIGTDVQDFFVRKGVVHWLTFNGKVRTSSEKSHDLFKTVKGASWYTLTCCGKSIVATGFNYNSKTNHLVMLSDALNFTYTYELNSEECSRLDIMRFAHRSPAILRAPTSRVAGRLHVPVPRAPLRCPPQQTPALQVHRNCF